MANQYDIAVARLRDAQRRVHRRGRPWRKTWANSAVVSQGTLVDSGDVELEWLENPVATVKERESSSESSGTSVKLHPLELLTCRVNLRFLK